MKITTIKFTFNPVYMLNTLWICISVYLFVMGGIFLFTYTMGKDFDVEKDTLVRVIEKTKYHQLVAVGVETGKVYKFTVSYTDYDNLNKYDEFTFKLSKRNEKYGILKWMLGAVVLVVLAGLLLLGITEIYDKYDKNYSVSFDLIKDIKLPLRLEVKRNGK